MEKIDKKIEIKEEEKVSENEQVEIVQEENEKIEAVVEETSVIKKTTVETKEVEKEEIVETETEAVVEETVVETDQTEEDQFENLLEESLGNIKNLEIGDQVEGQVIKITDSYIFISLGGKRDAYAEKTEYQNKNGDVSVEVGQTLKGYVVKYTDTETLIAKSLVSVNKRVLKEAFEQEIPINGKVSAFTKGGFIINISNVRAFCPKTHIDFKKVVDVKNYIGKNFDFKIIDFKDNGKDIVVSRKALLLEEANRIKKETLEKLELGSVVTGKVTRLTNFGAFVNLGGIEGLLHISELSWGRVESPSEVVSIGAEVEIQIIKIDGDKISLSIKALLEDPYNSVVKDLKEGDIVTCRVLRNLPFGSFVEIKPGVEGLIPISELTMGRRINHPSEILKEGEMVEVQVLRINIENKKISLSLKALQPDPWDNINESISEQEIVTGVIENVANFGAFIRLKDGIVGLMPNSKMKLAGLKIDKSNIGEEFKVKVANIDAGSKRISLEPTNMPESSTSSSFDDNWKKYKSQKNNDLNDSPFADL